MHKCAPEVDPSLEMLAKFRETRDAFERHLKVFGHAEDAQTDVLQAKYEADLEAVTKTTPSSVEGYQAVVQELCYQVQQGLSRDAISRWLDTFVESIWDLHRYARR